MSQNGFQNKSTWAIALLIVMALAVTFMWTKQGTETKPATTQSDSASKTETSRDLESPGHSGQPEGATDVLREMHPRGFEAPQVSTEPFGLSLKLMGTVLREHEDSSAVILNEASGEEGLYEVGDTIDSATLLKIEKESVVLEKDGVTRVLRITWSVGGETQAGDMDSEDGPPFTGVAEEFEKFEPVVVEEGPPVDPNAPVTELPHFEPIVVEGGPPVDPNMPVKELPPFEPFTSPTGPPVKSGE